MTNGDVTLLWDDDIAAWVAHYTRRRYRFLLSDGQTIDVVAYRDDSLLRGQVLIIADRQRNKGRTKGQAPEQAELRIEGFARLPDVEEPQLWDPASTRP